MKAMKHRIKEGAFEIGGITFVKSDCSCTSCQYVMCVEHRNEQEDGTYDLKVWCQLEICPQEESKNQ